MLNAVSSPLLVSLYFSGGVSHFACGPEPFAMGAACTFSAASLEDELDIEEDSHLRVSESSEVPRPARAGPLVSQRFVEQSPNCRQPRYMQAAFHELRGMPALNLAVKQGSVLLCSSTTIPRCKVQSPQSSTPSMKPRPKQKVVRPEADSE